MKKTEIKRLDVLWSKKVKERANHICEYCLKEGVMDQIRLNSCHIIGRANRSTRWDLENGICLCYRHHRDYDTHQPAHEDIREYVIGKDRLERLTIKAKQSGVAKYQDYEEIKESLL